MTFMPLNFSPKGTESFWHFLQLRCSNIGPGISECWRLGKERQKSGLPKIYARNDKVRSTNATLKIAKEELEKKVE